MSDTISTSQFFLAAAAVGATGDSNWDERLATYLRLRTLCDADAEFGANAKANEAHSLVHMEAEGKFGANYKSHPQARPILDAANETLRAAEDRWSKEYCGPMWAAARMLVLTRAPNPAAAMLKFQIIRLEDLDNDTGMTADVCDVLESDLGSKRLDDDLLIGMTAWQQSHRELRAFTDEETAEPGETLSPAERAIWAVIESAEKKAQTTIATTPAGIATQLFMALPHLSPRRDIEQHIADNNIDALVAIDGELDWSERLVLAAIRSLQAMGA